MTFAYGSLGAPTSAEVRTLLRQWQARNRWTFAQIGNAMRTGGHSNVAGAERMAGFVQSRVAGLHEDALRSIRRFLLTYPAPESYEALMAQLQAEAVERFRAEQDRPLRERIRREQERAEHQRYWLSRERAPRRRESANPLAGFDKATVRALSGGTLG